MAIDGKDLSIGHFRNIAEIDDALSVGCCG